MIGSNKAAKSFSPLRAEAWMDKVLSSPISFGEGCAQPADLGEKRKGYAKLINIFVNQAKPGQSWCEVAEAMDASGCT